MINQEIYDLIFDRVQKLGYDCHPFLPKEGTSYPFVVLGEAELRPKMTKSFSIGEVSIFIHVWTKKESRKECEQMCHKIANSCHKFTSPHLWVLLDGSTRVLADNSTNETLWHGILNLTYKFY